MLTPTNGCGGEGPWRGLAPPCRAACPVDKDVPGFLRAVAKGDATAAWRIAYRDNLFPTVLGWICPKPCESACRLGEVREPVRVCALKRWVTWAHEPPEDMQGPALGTGPSIAIVGAGPAGLAAAHDLALAGARVTLLDREEQPGGLLRGCIPGFRLPPEAVEEDVDRILSLGIEFRPGFVLRDPSQLDALRAEFSAIVLAVGPGDDRPPPVRDWRVTSRSGTAIGFLRAVAGGALRLDGLRVVVVGGGNGAFDAARAARRAGASDVRILYRRGRAELRAFPEDVHLAEAEGIVIEDRTIVQEISWNGTGPRGLACARTEPERRGSGAGSAPPVAENSEHFRPCDAVVFALGQSPTVAFAAGAPDVFVAGNRGGNGTVAEAIASGRRTARELIETLDRRGAWPEREGARPGGPSAVSGSARLRSDRPAGVMTRETAMRESARCLGCDRVLALDPEACILCGRCAERCAWDALRWRPAADGNWELVIRDADCRRCGDCVDQCPVRALDWRPWRLSNRFDPIRPEASASPGGISRSVSAGRG